MIYKMTTTVTWIGGQDADLGILALP